MGIAGLTTFLERNNFFENYRLHDTVVIIDGYNLIYQHFFKNQEIICDHMYGGDYSSLASHVKYIFKCLQKCKVQPIVIFDGSIDPSLEKLNTMLQRSEGTLNIAHKIYDNNVFIEGVMPLLADSIYCLQLEQLGIPIYQCCYEADETIIQMAFDLKCPIMSNDSDFFLYNLPEGVILLRSLFTDNFHVCNDKYNYIKCKIYRISNLKRIFPYLELDLAQIIGFLLGNDYVDAEVQKSLIRKISQFKEKPKMIRDVFHWISKHRTLESTLEHLSDLLKNPNHDFIRLIKNHFLLLKNDQVTGTLETYLEPKHMEKLLLQNISNVEIPHWMRPMFIRRKICYRVLSISKVHIDWCRPLVEDFSFSSSSYHAADDLMRKIYGVLRNQDKNIQNVKRFCRKNNQFKPEKVVPLISLGKDMLPKLKEIGNLNLEDRVSLFFKITQIDDQIIAEIQKFFKSRPEMNCCYDYSLLVPFSSMIFCLIFMLRNFPDHVWIEFVYAIYVNIWLSGFFGSSESSPMFLKLNATLRETVKQKLLPFTSLPVLSCAKVFMPRVVHFYNVYQACLDNLNLLSQILNVKNLFNSGIMLCALKGTFIYNLTAELSSRPKPLLYIQELLQRQQFKPLNVFIDLLDFVVSQSDRYLLFQQKPINDLDILPKSLHKKMEKFPGSNSNGTIEKKYFARGFDVTNKKTHVKSQKLKLKTQKS